MSEAADSFWFKTCHTQEAPTRLLTVLSDSLPSGLQGNTFPIDSIVSKRAGTSCARAAWISKFQLRHRLVTHGVPLLSKHTDILCIGTPAEEAIACRRFVSAASPIPLFPFFIPTSCSLPPSLRLAKRSSSFKRIKTAIHHDFLVSSNWVRQPSYWVRQPSVWEWELPSNVHQEGRRVHFGLRANVVYGRAVRA